MQKTIKDTKGITLIESVVSIFILAIAVLTIYSLFNMSLKVIWESKAKTLAMQLANQKMEMTRNLPYDQVGTVGGIPAGSIVPLEEVSKNNIVFTIASNVSFVDDPFDGTEGGNPLDTLATDYKKLRVEVSWTSRYGDKEIVFLTDIVPQGIETTGGGGTLKILVFDSQGQPVQQANVQITNNDVVPAIDLTTQTNSGGLVHLPGAPESEEAYHVTVSKFGYSTAQTYQVSGELPVPDPAPLSIYEGQVTSISFAIDLVSSLNVNIKDINDLGLADVSFEMVGAKTIGNDSEGLPVAKYEQTHTSNHLGETTLSSLEWDSYTFSLPESSLYEISETNPLQPLDLLPEVSGQMDITLSAKNPHSVLVVVKDTEDQPLAGASVWLYNLFLGLNQTIVTGSAGQAYFSPWQEASSTLEVNLPGHNDHDDILDISGYFTEEVIMTTL